MNNASETTFFSVDTSDMPQNGRPQAEAILQHTQTAKQQRNERSTTPSNVDFIDRGVQAPDPTGTMRPVSQDQQQETATPRVDVRSTEGEYPRYHKPGGGGGGVDKAEVETVILRITLRVFFGNNSLSSRNTTNVYCDFRALRSLRPPTTLSSISEEQARFIMDWVTHRLTKTVVRNHVEPSRQGRAVQSPR
ncbi:hypothetical protein SARC_02935 [Sphaeroforma arctica JP610]|uniref:Uncharacterized protein n=1 Tax=Sphaeroforma arctica JP610 TaxID=667725 RepID=A0A0L0G9B2_9EUKA|nr:hypothetical protein SARC_02935 [Sphaeroforma arctica JP610]KNC84853.1 hypothetical protein SARC_02935 [Sphaeroforma arctica JP610]|eukprot:XP_014158755.1 hypothetical protein SARC_02935 [Sphaeroforma arctica JP610]